MPFSLITAAQMEDLIAELRIAVLPTDTAELAARTIEQLKSERDNLQEQTTSYLRQAREAYEEKLKLFSALNNSVLLQSHYAELLNMHDGGERITFADAEAWLKRLDKLVPAYEQVAKYKEGK